MQYRQGRMDNNTYHLLVSELTTSGRYLERIFKAIQEVPALYTSREIRRDIQRLYVDFSHFLEDNLFLPQYDCEREDSDFDSKQITDEFKNIHQLILSFLRMRPDRDHTINFAVAYNNLVYEYAHLLHTHCAEFSTIEILYPRTSLSLTSNDEQEKVQSDNAQESTNIPKFILSEETIINFGQDDQGILQSLEWKRKKVYEDLLESGHKDIFNDHYEKGLQKFIKAGDFLETAEVFTLIGWAYSLMNQLEKAKTHCLNAIRLDPSYGPPYNDIGSYLLTEGKINDSLKWFELAKKATVYQNREYPYINSGRAYLLQKKNTLALDQFSKALTLAPYHSELHQTILKLKKNLNKSKTANEEDMGMLTEIGNFLGKNHEYNQSHDSPEGPSNEWT